MDKLFLGCGVARFHTTEQRGQPGRLTDSTPIVGQGRGLRQWSEIFLEGVPPIGSPTDSPKTAKETPARPMEEAGVASKIDHPGESSTTADWDKMPPLGEEEAIAELDAAIDKAGDEGEEEPEPLDEVDIGEGAHCIKDDSTLHLVLGLTDPYWASMALVVGVQKLHKYQAHKKNWKRSQVLSYGRLVNCYGINKDQLQEISVMGKLRQKPKKHKARQDERVVVFKQQPGSEGHPTTS